VLLDPVLRRVSPAACARAAAGGGGRSGGESSSSDGGGGGDSFALLLPASADALLVDGAPRAAPAAAADSLRLDSFG
jgi:hypothetical protein